MKWSMVVVVVSVFSCSQGQDFNSWCPNLHTDLSTCVNQYLKQLQTIGNQFTDASKVLDVRSLVARESSIICHPEAETIMDNFYGCIYGKMWACIPSDWKNVFPGLDKAKAALRFMCDNKDDMDFPCLGKTETQLKMFTCLGDGIQKPSDMSTADAFLKYTCSLTAKYNPCTEAVYGECKKKTVEVMKKVYAYQIPVGCDACMSKASPIILIAFLILAFVNKNIL